MLNWFVLSILVSQSLCWLVLKDPLDFNPPGPHKFSINGKSKPLILTEYLNQNEFGTAKEKSKVNPLVGNAKSYSGFFTVDPVNQSNLFFWYFPALLESSTAPVVVWLQGGPGGSSLYGLFLENGPYFIDDYGEIKEREYSWTRTMHMVYIDNPVATGFSFTESYNSYTQDQISIGRNLYLALVQFYQTFPDLLSNPLYIASESYGGKYAVSLAHKIHQTNQNTDFHINLQGLIQISSFIDPFNQIDYGNFLYGVALIDKTENKIFQIVQNVTKESVLENNYQEAFEGFLKLLGKKDSLYNNLAGYTYAYNYLKTKSDLKTAAIDEFLQRDEIRKEIHVGNLDFRSLDLTGDVYYKLINDFMKSVRNQLNDLANRYDLLFMNGQLDVITAYQLTSNVVDNLRWCGANDLKRALKRKLYVGLELAGYMKQGDPPNGKCLGSISKVMVRNAGHMVPSDQPKFAYHIVNTFVQSKIN